MEEVKWEDVKNDRAPVIAAAKRLAFEVVGKTLEEAKKMLEDAGVAMRLFADMGSAEVDDGRVKLQVKNDVVVEAMVG